MSTPVREERPCWLESKCVDCSDCVEGCPENCISKVEGEKTIVFDFNVCVGCGVCVLTCPEKAIEMIPEPEEK